MRENRKKIKPAKDERKKERLNAKDILKKMDITKPGRKKEIKTAVDMTQGNILKHILNFSALLFMGNLLQQLYTVVDAWVVGNFATNEAFSAIGVVSPIISVLIGLFVGVSTGAGVVVSQYYGAGKNDKVRESVHTAMTSAFVFGAILTVVGVALVPTILRFMNIPEAIFDDAKTYLTTYFFGILGLVVYNMGTGVLGGVGDARRPLFFLVSASINIVLDLVFVIIRCAGHP